MSKVDIIECEPLTDGEMLVLQKVGRVFNCYTTSPQIGVAPIFLAQGKSRRLAYMAFEKRLKEDVCDTQ